MNYIYIKKFSDVNGYDLPSYKKIGFAKDVEERRKQLSGTKSPIFVETICAWELPDDNARAVEQAIHGLLLNKRTDGEWFIDEENSIVDAISRLMSAFKMKQVDISGYEEKEMVIKRNNNLSEIMEDYLLRIKAECKIDFQYKCNAVEITMLSAPNTFYLQMRKKKYPRLVVTGNIFKNNFDFIKDILGREEAGKRVDEKAYDCGYWDDVSPKESAKLINALLEKHMNAKAEGQSST
ncbi:GIY-YIG nuclease family protein [Geobacter sp. DSM 9736]|uniref:GIY-YIG nuclease family protein n=1 Tax=Geobacter sp. DSM 9736 TaxID=1277350 RepID=UPI000B506268|nr:GIY-YIG nuclease family protein [Geobacter sp. DSM 9736]SNB46292.1 T5orf172 domain-containing protein [Geobacter sp. DSM 9736]